MVEMDRELFSKPKVNVMARLMVDMAGMGGNVYLEATTNLNTLEPYRFVKDYKAENGKQGLGNLRRGANAPDLILKVPLGTVVKVGNFTADTNSQPKNQEPTSSDLDLNLDLV